VSADGEHLGRGDSAELPNDVAEVILVTGWPELGGLLELLRRHLIGILVQSVGDEGDNVIVPLSAWRAWAHLDLRLQIGEGPFVVKGRALCGRRRRATTAAATCGHGEQRSECGQEVGKALRGYESECPAHDRLPDRSSHQNKQAAIGNGCPFASDGSVPSRFLRLFSYVAPVSASPIIT
jgi:hypothetical protein